MAQVEVLNIDTKEAQSSLKALQNQLKILKDRMAGLDPNSETFKKLAKEAGNLKTQIDNVNNSVRNASKGLLDMPKSVKLVSNDLGKIIGQLGKVGAGISGGFNLIGTAMSMMGQDSDESREALQQLQLVLNTVPIQIIAFAQAFEVAAKVLDTAMRPSIEAAIESFDKLFNGVDNVFNDIKDNIDNFEKYVSKIDTIEKSLFGNTNRVDSFGQKIVQLQSKIAQLNIEMLSLNKTDEDYEDSMRRIREEIDAVKNEIQSQTTEYVTNTKEAYNNATAIDKVIAQLRLYSASISTLQKAWMGVLGLGLAAAIAGLTYGIIELKKAQKEYNDELDKTIKGYNDLYSAYFNGLRATSKQVATIRALYRTANDLNKSDKVRKSQLEELNRLVPDYNGYIDKATRKLKGNTKAIDDNVKALQDQAIAQAAVNLIAKKYEEMYDIEQEINNQGLLQDKISENEKKYAQLQQYIEAKKTDIYGTIKSPFSDEEIKQIISDYNYYQSAEVQKGLKNLDTLKSDLKRKRKEIEDILDYYKPIITPEKPKDTGVSVSTKVEVDATGRRKDTPHMSELKAPTQYIKPKPIIVDMKFGSFLADGKEYRTIEETSKDLFKDLYDLDNDGDIKTFKINITIGDFAENERLRRWVDFVNEMQHQLDVLNDTMQRFGESSLGLGGDYANVVTDFQNMFAQISAINEQITEGGKVAWYSYTQAAATGIQAVGTLLNALSNEQDTTNKKGFEEQKKLQVGATVVNTLAGVVNAWSSALAITPPVGPILAAANSAMMVTLGGIQIAKILSRKFGDTSNPSAASMNSTIIPPVQYSQAVQNANIEQKLGDNRVYVTETDISNTQNRVRVQERENTY